MVLICPIRQEFLTEIALDDGSFKQFLYKTHRSAKEVLCYGRWVVGVALRHVRQQTQDTITLHMRPSHRRRMVNQGRAHGLRRKASCH